jgi:hypothetical protein
MTVCKRGYTKPSHRVHNQTSTPQTPAHATNQTAYAKREYPNPSHSATATRSLYNTRPVNETRTEDTVRVLEHAVLETDDNELTALEARLEEATDILCMR